MLFFKKAVLAKIETVYGTDPVPTGAANAVLAKVLSIDPYVADMQERNVVLPYFGSLGAIPAATKVTVGLEVELAGSGAAGTAPPWGALLRACGLSETVSAGVDVTYALVSATFESVTLYFSIDGVQHKVTGCRGNVSFEFTNEGIPMAKYSFTGIFNAPTDTALPTLTLTAWQKPLPVNKVNTTFSLHSYAAIMASLSFDLGNEVLHKAYVNTTEDVRITNRKVAGSVSVEAALLATKNWYTTVAAATTGALAMVHGTTAGNKIQIDAPAVQPANPKYDDADGIAMMGMDLIFQSTAANNQLTIKAL
jgi:hypothetical protein